jgi:type I restriction enzyme S subunit
MEYSLVSLADCCVIKPPKAEARAALKPDDLVSFVPMDSLGINKKVLKLEKTRALADVSGSYTYFAENDVLLAKITPCFENGKLGIATGLTNGIGFGSSEFIVFRPNEHLNSEYLYYFLNQPSFRGAGQAVMTGAVGHKRVPKDFIQATQIPLPPIPEQQRIVAILDQAFADIEKARANAEKNLKNARELFDSYLNQVFVKCNSSVELGEVVELLTDYHANGSYEVLKQHVELKEEEDFAWMVRSTDFEKKFKNVKRYISEHAYYYLRKSKLFGGEIIMSKIGNAGKVYFMPDADRPCSLAMNLFLIRLDASRANNEYVYRYLNSTSGKAQIAPKLKGAATQTITKDNVRSLLIPLPSLDKQQLNVGSLRELEREIEALEKLYQNKIHEIENLKKSLLQKAFSGELTKTEGMVA